MKMTVRSFVLACLCLGFTSAAAAAVFNVTTTTDGGPGSLRQAIIDANASPGLDTINVPAGTYLLTIPGALENLGATGDIDITQDVTIVGAGAATTIIDGGALDRVFDIQSGATNVSISGVTIRNGLITSARGLLGAGINAAGGTLTLTGVIVTANTGLAGAGIASNGTVVLVSSSVTNNINNSSGNSGGGIRTGTLTATDSTISGNSAPGQGGGIFTGNLTLDRSTVSGNTSTGDQGGGIFAINGTVTITNSTISGNSAPVSQGGGGLFNNPPIGTANSVTILNSTITNNSGGGLYTFSPGVFTLKNTIVAGNTGPDCTGDVASQGNNLIQNTTGCDISGVLTGNVTGVSAQLGPLANNGGPTQTHALLAGSPAIDAGTSVGAPAVDQRGVARPVGVGVDIGAFEGSLAGALPTLSINNVSANEGNAGTTNFTFTVTLSAPSASTVTVNYATANGTATAGSDYTAASGIVTFTPGQTTQSIVVSVLGDTVVESNETFQVNLSSPVNATVASGSGVGTIVNDDVGTPPPPVAPVANIPTLSEWTLALLVALVAGMAALSLRKRRR